MSSRGPISRTTFESCASELDLLTGASSCERLSQEYFFCRVHRAYPPSAPAENLWPRRLINWL